MFRPTKNLNAAVFDSVTVGLAKRLEQGEIKNIENLQKIYHELIDNQDFKAAYQSSTSSTSSLRTRLDIATDYFKRVK